MENFPRKSMEFHVHGGFSHGFLRENLERFDNCLVYVDWLSKN